VSHETIYQFVYGPAQAVAAGYRAAIAAGIMTLAAAGIAYAAAIVSAGRQTRLENAKHEAAVSGYRFMQIDLTRDYTERLGKFANFIRLDDYDEQHSRKLDITEVSMKFTETIQVPEEWRTTAWRDQVLLGEEFTLILARVRNSLDDLLRKLPVKVGKPGAMGPE
jgi:hypothetical protein